MTVSAMDAAIFSNIAYNDINTGLDAGLSSGWQELNMSAAEDDFNNSYYGRAFIKVVGNVATEVVVAHRGTSPWQPGDLISDLTIAAKVESANIQKDDALEFLESVENTFISLGYNQSADFNSITTNTGHSLGGWLATHVAHSMGSNGKAITFDSPASDLSSTSANLIHYLNPSNWINRAGGDRSGVVYRVEGDSTFYNEDHGFSLSNALAFGGDVVLDIADFVPNGAAFVFAGNPNPSIGVGALLKTIHEHSMERIIGVLNTAELETTGSSVSVEEYYLVGDYSNSGSVGGILKNAWDNGLNANGNLTISQIADELVTIVNSPTFNSFDPRINLQLGTSENNHFYSSIENDQVLLAYGGDDILNLANSNSHIVDGGEGIDFLDYSTYSDSTFVNVDLSAGNTYLNLPKESLPSGSPKDTFVNVEGVLGTINNDIILGNLEANYLDGYNGDDELDGSDGNDTLNGGAGNDIIDGGLGFDWLVYDEDDVAEGLTVTITEQDTVLGGFSGTINEAINTSSENGVILISATDQFSGIEGVKTSDLDDHIIINSAITSGQILSLDLMNGINTIQLSANDDITSVANFFISLGETGTVEFDGDAGNDNITGYSGDDIFLGGTGNDNLVGDAGNDSLSGGSDSDSIYGGDNNDTLIGDGGNDHLYGGAGTDTFWFDKADGEDTIYGGDATDRIEIFYNNTSVSENIANGVTPSTLQGTAAILEENPTWDYGFTYGNGHQAYFNWAGDPEVEGATGRLVVDFDYNGSNLYDLIIEDFASGDFGIQLEGAEEEEEGSGNAGGNPFSTPGSGGAVNWQSSGLLIGEDLIPIWEAIGAADEILDGGIVISTGEEGTGIIGYGANASHSNEDSHNIVALRETAQGSGFPDADIGAAVKGDPHIVSYDGLLYDFQDTGEFTLARSTNDNGFNVQARMREWDLGDAVGDKFSVNTAIATELNGVKVGFYINGSLPYDLTAAAADSDTLNDEEPVLYIGESGYFIPDQGIIFVEDGYVYRNGDTYTVINGSGDVIEVTVHDEYIDFKASSPASRQGNVEGLLGNFDSDTTNDFTLDNGTDLGSSISSNTLYNVFGEDWRITQSESLFLYGAGENTSSFDNPDFDNVQRTLADFDPALVAAAQSAAIAEGFDSTSTVFDAAVLDFLVMGYVEYDETWQELEAQTLIHADISNPADIIMGTAGNDSLIGTADKDYMMGLEGDDTIYGRGDNDTIVGGQGNDTIYGEGGVDHYIHNQGDGNDTIFSGEYLSFDHITMNDSEGNQLTIDDLMFNVSGWDLLVSNRLSGETLTLEDMYYSTGKTFAAVNGIDIRTTLTLNGSDGDDTIYGTGYADTIEGGLGNDTIYGRTGVDVYLHNEGDGNDVIYSGEANSSDSIIMQDASGTALTQDDLQFEKSGWNLIVTNRSSDESITIVDQFAFSGKTISNVNGIDITGGLVFAGTDASETVKATGYADTLEGGLGDDTLYGYTGVDTYLHNEGDGNDVVYGGEANSSDTIIMNDATGTLLAEENLFFEKNGVDLLVSNRSNGETITIKDQFAFSGKTIGSVNGIDITGGINFVGTDAAEVVNGTSYGDTIESGQGNDTIFGSYGADTYIHNEGDGNDIINSGEYNSSDVISMRDANGVEIAEIDLQFSIMGWDLVVTDTNTNETLILDNMYYSTGHTFATLNGIDLDTVI